MKKTDVTNQVEFDNPDDEYLPLVKCICGAKFIHWDFPISLYEDDPDGCPECGAKYIYENKIKVFRIEE